VEQYASGLCGRSNTSASIESCPWASVTFGGRSQNSSGIIIANGTTKGSRIGSSRGARLFAARDKFVGVRGSVACSIITSERRDNQRLRPDLRSAQIWDTTSHRFREVHTAATCTSPLSGQ
jgi:hypothetical protein